MVIKMNKRVELPIVDALYSAYQYQGPSTAIAVNNPTLRNWYLNERMNLACNRKFLNGYTTPHIVVPATNWKHCPYIEQIEISSQFVGGYINHIIRKMLDEGYYVIYGNIDDYYVEGKSWYKERHFRHDGMICGYDQEDKTYCLYAYDSNWIYHKFWTSQRSINKGRIAVEKQGLFSKFTAVKVTEDQIEFSPQIVYDNLMEYLDSDLHKYPEDGEGNVKGIIVHEYIAKYLGKLFDGSIPYERMDRRIFRLIWEHKKVMLERIEKIEQSLDMGNEISEMYRPLVAEADLMRMLYASHHMKRRDSALPIIQKKLRKLMQEERKILERLLTEMDRRFKNETVEIHKTGNAETSLAGDR